MPAEPERAKESCEKYWREEIQQIGFWLGVFPVHFQALEQQAKRYGIGSKEPPAFAKATADEPAAFSE